MKKRKEKILSFMLAFLIIISSVHLPVFTAKAAEVTKDNDANETVDSIEEIEEEPIAAWPEEPAWISQDTKDLQQPDMEEGSFDHVIYGRLLQEMTENELIHCQNESNGIVEGEETTFANSVMMQRIAKDVTACIKYETQLYINGKKYTGGDIQVTKGDNVAYIHTWQPNIATGEMIGNGDWFEYTLFKIPNLNIASYSDPQPLMINGIRVGTWKLTYNKTTGEMRYRVTFNRYIQLFDLNTIRAKLQGSGSFSNASQGTQIEYNGQTNGLVIIERPAIQPSVPSGTGWRPPVPSFGTKIYKFGKGVKWNSSYDPTALPQIDWRVIFFDFLQKKQQEYLEGATISPTSGNCIIEENLDENQQFLWTNETRFGGSPFHLELPVITAGTDQLLNGGVGYGEVNGDYNGPGEINPYIRGADLIEVKEGRTAKTEKEVKAVQDEVRNRPCSWTVTTDPVTKKQTLLINLGVLGGTDSSKGITWDKVYRKNDWPEKGINSRITECENTIKALETGDNSPLTLLDQRHQAVVNKLLEVLKRPENADQATQMESELQLWRDNYRIWRSKPETTPLASLTAIPLPDTEMYYMIEVKAPEGYVLDQDPISFRLDEKVFPTDQNGEIIETGTPGLVKRAENTKYEYGIRLIKKDSTDKKPLNRVGFTISKGNQEIAVKPVSNTPGWYEVNPGGQRNTMYTNTNGIVRINGLEPDVTYTIKETQIPKGYIKMDPVEIRIPSSKTGVIEESGHIYVEKEFLNQRALGKVILHKQDGDTGNALVGAKFQLYSVKLESISDNKVKRIETPIGDAKSTNEQGDLIFENLEWGQYCIRETDAPSGYVLSQEVHDFTIGKDSLREGDWLTVSFPHVRNQRQIGEAVLRKTDQKDSGKKLPNATFTLWKKFLDENGKEHWVRYGRDTRTTDENGEIKFRLPLGTYKVIEVAAPEGYLLPTGKAAEKEFVIQENAQDQNPAPIAFDIPNAPNLQKLKVEKKVTGAMGDKTQTFTFDIMLSHPNGTALNITLPYRECNAESQESMEQLSFIDGKATVKLSHNQSIMIENIPYGTHYEVKEREEGKDSYDTTYNGQKKIATGSMTLSNSGITEVIIENRRESVPDTGIFMNSSMGGMIAALGVLGVILLFIILSWKKRGK